ncbi:hypothetical protein PBV87_07370 [Niameybacter massiliensis]|uniref:Uncharacterized protein n=1 Tax=Holtiella tumoricola TaxID=3018743 RepID=A0AA42J0L5_9FIRM|nr:hypothetical protein [Holtiella tumoricola]MDA3731298.1 hypothetical protein [Holtiella tumoricola]
MKTLRERSSRYWLAHKILPNYIFTNTKLFLEKVCTGSDTDVYRFINFLWERAQRKVAEKPTVYMPQVIKEEREDTKVLVMSMPIPEATLEAYYVGVVYNNAKEVRYFVLESSNLVEEDVIACMCEWTKDGKHLNYGFTKDIAIENFIKFILDECMNEEYKILCINPLGTD